MMWTEFSFLYLAVNLVLLMVIKKSVRAQWRPLLRTLLFATLIMLVFDSLAEHRSFWEFPLLAGLHLFEVPVENMAITLGTVTNSLLLYLLFAYRLRRHS